jgi:hypothetical protein
MAAIVAPGLEMVAHEHGIEPQLLCENAEIQQFSGAELFCRRLIAKLELHDFSR